MLEKESPIKGIIKSLGLVFGDIGTSPIYTVTVVFLLLKPTADNVMGVMSLIIWTMTILVSLQYVILAMRLSRRGEGGTIVLKEILSSLLSSKRKAICVTIMAFIGISLLMGDGVITPAISILSAVEGTALIPGLEHISKTAIVLISAFIAVCLFSIQFKGTGKISASFGPIVAVWLSSLAFSGIISIFDAPQVLKAVNPYYAVSFLLENGWAGFIVLSEIFLCATGGEALYADMGHLGAKPIRHGWIIAFFALSLNYLGQGAFLLAHPGAKSILFEMVFYHVKTLYVPFLLLSIAATVIASQAMISGTFSIVYQAITTHIMPLFKVDYTSTELRSQIYIGFINWFLLVAVLFIMFEFGESSKLAAAYGLAVTGTMTLTGIMMIWIFSLQRKYYLTAISVFITLIDIAYLGANFTKIPHGGYWSIIIALIPFSIIMIYTRGQVRLYRSMKPMPKVEFLKRYDILHKTTAKIGGTALFFARDVERIPPYIVRTMFTNNILYEDNIIVSIIRRDDPFGVTGYFKGELADGLRHFEIQLGYMEVIDVEEILREAGIKEKSIFYGLEDIATRNIVWKIFSIFKRLTPAYVQFYKLPSHKLHGVITRVEM
ncbi:MAG: KUP/HAK/KT family potassium transporter [Nitrospirae bacterium]|nr:KUP/HAK/KT family potassium transporter [Nitrospirota bacterium]